MADQNLKSLAFFQDDLLENQWPVLSCSAAKELQIDSKIKTTDLTVTGNVGIATTAAPTARLEVNGNVKATSFLGDGSNLTGVVKNLDLAVKKAGDTMSGALTIQNSLSVTGEIIAGSIKWGNNSLNSDGTTVLLNDAVRLDKSWLPHPKFEDVTYTTRFTIQCPQSENSSVSFHSPGGSRTALVTDGPIMSYESGAYFAGNVGIGINSPTARLHIADYGRGNLKFLAKSGVGHDIGYDGGNDSSFWFAHFGAETGDTRFRWDNGSSARELLVIQNNGNIIGKFVQSSSKTLKENIDLLSLQEAAQTLAGLNPVKFNYKTDSDQHQNIGFIAEDVPELLATSDRKGVSIMDIVGLLTKVLQEQQKIILELAEKVKSLEAKIPNCDL
ncbi:tail fiber domain-containing protein [Microcystis aeruginosa]|uniref:tail fiber domain-containing protein n=1 Tax=Microcystis aeruginosa TaxID=1126 RepID=UPI0009322E10|nr:tail fiber domain-containing protein [Microcystis aeruginosa]